MSTKETGGQPPEPTFHAKVQGKVEEVKGKVESARARRTGDMGKRLEGDAKQFGRVDQAISTAIENVIADEERSSAQGILEGQHHRVHGALEESAGKVQAKLGHARKDTEQEAMGLAKQAAGQAEKQLGRAEEEQSRKAFKDAVQADAEYMKPGS